ncbi:uncharacterized protein SPSK_01247 [Sporothrix schenckii 1099-18]|uniref:Uncharacterized protein n=1 Tax=Sporothrix schenckii 1099-18 TaxID=1397361 RepID=A0A0F2LVD2_SPOSC|nr:uncharacterized protein SPSK_01247 [Sporothrix schenckii 1099-18]KJR81423.1 hypothetical protein SPSK_01247 [Sporothrix schenckii 1099-18]
MLSQGTSIVAAAALLSFAGLARGAGSTAISSVLVCTDNIYADGFIYRNTTGDGTTSTSLDSFAAKDSFPLYLSVTSHSGAPLDPIQPARKNGFHDYTSLDQNLYINVTAGAFAPVGFVDGGNASLGTGETTWGFYAAYGFVMWYNLPSSSSAVVPSSTPVHIQGFQWVPVKGYTNVTQLYWNQTQYDEAAAEGARSTISAAGASFGLCSSDVEASVKAE